MDPGPPESPPRPSPARPYLVLAALCLALWVPTCGLWDLYGHDEPRYVTVAREWIGNGGGWVMTLHGEPYSQKGPLGLWAIAAFLSLGGTAAMETLARLPSVLAGTGTVLLAFALARRLHGERAAWFAALALFASPLVLDLAPTARLDMPFTAWIVLAAYVWLGRTGEGPILWSRWALLWGAVGGAVLTKGPLAILLALCVVGGEAAAARSWRVFRDARPLAGIGAVLGLAAAWLGAQAAGAGTRFVVAMLESATVERVAGEVHSKPPWFYVPQLLLVLAPWSLLLVPAARDHLRGRRDLPPRVAALWTWLAVPFLVLSVASGKRTVYLLPLLPPAAILAGAWLDRAAPRGEILPRASRAAGAALLLAAAILGVGVAAASRDPALLDRLPFAAAPHLAGVAVAGGALLAAAGLALLLRSVSAEILVRTGAGMLLAGALVDYAVVMPAETAQKGTRAFSSAVEGLLRESGGPAELGVVATARDAQFHAYGRYRIRHIDGGASAFEDPAAVPRFVLFVEGEAPHMREAAERAGYAPAWRGEAGGERLVVLRRGPR